ncbi:NADPH-dependent FMN reductase [Humidesulfovibrio mexicanus]|uniref:NADPH-dependent FMN reductase n=1 Tax=Humidesulfovibrio mexicanus TaxID=147047 RepID=A0A238Y9J4_9BACT|nr:NAD(P)H-dependent oxidoreductase [Humidesulfovibrio mexicanus]SNR67283.1 NADPH-dependent FMN reductase [Humidesulfovibrio mexicanus]
MTGEVLVLACSHRAGGNSDAAAQVVAEAAGQAGARARVLALRDFSVLPCLACLACAKDNGSRCVLAGKDQAEELFAALMRADAVVVASPIYFYGLPSRCKTWVDRSQRFWEARRKGEAWIAALPQRRAFACLVAGQPGGRMVFEGARLTLKYFLVNFGLELAEPLGLRGVDARGEFAANADALDAVRGLGRQAGQAAVQAARNA